VIASTTVTEELSLLLADGMAAPGRYGMGVRGGGGSGGGLLGGGDGGVGGCVGGGASGDGGGVGGGDGGWITLTGATLTPMPGSSDASELLTLLSERASSTELLEESPTVSTLADADSDVSASDWSAALYLVGRPDSTKLPAP